MMKLERLLESITPLALYGKLYCEIKGIVYDSRKIKKDYLFICIKGFQDDGHRYIEEAVAKGACAVVIEKEIDYYHKNISYIKVKDCRKAMAYLSACFYKYPLTELKLIGVTGTNGKTTTTYLIKEIIEQAGFKCGLIGTINVYDGENLIKSDRTTPEAPDLYQYFDIMRKKEVDYVVMEVSSHALQLKRVAGMEFDAAVFTNISRDHLDFHNSIEEYVNIKSLLFKNIKSSGYAIINKDDNFADKMILAAKGNDLTYSFEKEADFKAEKVSLKADGSSFVLKGKEINLFLELNLTGFFNIYNTMAAVVCCLSLGVGEEKIKKGLEKIKGIPGRFELIDLQQKFSVIVDYAHTPDGMENVLSTATDLTSGKIILVFGCGGDRDREKRPMMGKIGIKYADYCIITSDNPRSEEPIKIIKQIEAGILDIQENKKNYQIINDRKKAIFQAVKMASPGDIVMIVGKGHETYQIFKDKTIYFDDREIARQAIKKKLQGDL